MLNILRVRFSNFFSFGNEVHTIDFTASTTTLVIATNGSGKSAGTLDSICFALYGRSYRDINKSQIVNCITEKNCLVEIDFSRNSHDYTVKRGIKPNVFEIWKNGQLLPQPGDIRDYQRHLEEDILGMDYKTLKQVVVIGKADHLPFLKLVSQQRREMVEDILDLKVFTVMRQIVKGRADMNGQQLVDVDKRLIAIRAELDVEKRHAAEANADHAERISAITAGRREAVARITVWKADIETLNNQIEEQHSLLLDRADVVAEIERLGMLLIQLDAKKDAAEKQLKFFTDHATCPSCQQLMDEQQRNDQIKDLTERVNMLSVAKTKLVDMCSTNKAKRQKFLDVDKKILELEGYVTDIQQKIRMEARDQVRIGQELNELENVADADIKRIEDLESLNASTSAEKDKILAEAEIIAQAAALLKDNGVKARVIAKYIPLFNELINKYLEILGLFVGFELDQDFKETIKSRGRDKFTYESFSEGEKFRIDLAILFAWRDIAKRRNSTSANLLIFDEVLDGSLDHEGKMALINLLRETENVNIFVVSHDQEAYADAFERTLRFVKKANFSRIEQ